MHARIGKRPESKKYKADNLKSSAHSLCPKTTHNLKGVVVYIYSKEANCMDKPKDCLLTLVQAQRK
jgi:hypothetical protein